MRRLVFLLCALALWAAGAPAGAQLDGPALMREGNSLMRAGLPRAALLRYREARARELDSALLDYNFGIAHHALGDYAAAEQALLAARRDARLAALAEYNLGLTLRAAGRSSDARRWFEAASVSATDRRLATLARTAVQRLAAGADAAGPPRTARPASARAAPRIPQLKIMLDAGYGHDDNANRTPAEPYVDAAQPSAPLVTPAPVAAAYVPVKLRGRYLIPNESGDTHFHVGYGLDGRYYSDELANDESTQRIEIGADSVFGETPSRQRRLRSAFFVTRHFHRNFDPDDGSDRDIFGLDISQRFMYTGAGIEGDFDHTLGKWRWGLAMRFERREHERIPLVANYDNELYRVSASADYSLSSATRLTLGLHSYRRLFDDRPSRGLDGIMLSTNAPLEYGYEAVELGLTRRVMRWLEIDFGYARLERADRFAGYDDFSQDRLSLHATLKPGARFTVSVGAVSRVYDYPNAFAFNVPAAGPKELEDVTGEALVEFRVNDAFTVLAALGAEDVTSTDLRAEYNRALTSIALVWRR